MVTKRLVKPLAGSKRKDEGIIVKATRQVVFEDDISDLLRKRFFLFSPKINSTEMFYLQCWKVLLKYSVAYFKETRADKGSIEFIVDPIKGSAANEEKIDLSLIKKSIPSALISEKKLSEERAEKKAIVDARWKVLLSKFKRPPELEVVSVDVFYRPYYKVDTICGSKEGIQWIPADDFGNYFVYN